MVIRPIGFFLSVDPAAALVGGFASAFVPSELQIATALLSTYALRKAEHLLRVSSFELFLNMIKSK